MDNTTLVNQVERLRSAVDSAKIGIWDWDIVKNELVWDHQMYALYGITPKDFSGAYDAWQKGLHPEDRVQGDKEIHDAIDGKKDFDTMFRVVWPDSSIHWIKAYATIKRDETGKAISMVGVNWDITEKKQAEEKLQAKIAEIEEMNKLMVGRELRMAELKNENQALKKKLQI